MNKLLISILSISLLFSCESENQFNSNYPDEFKLKGEIKSIYEWTFGLAFYGEDSLMDSEFQYLHENLDIDRREIAYYKFDSSFHLVENGIKYDIDDNWDKTYFIGDSIEKSVCGSKTQLLKFSIDSIISRDTLIIVKKCNLDFFSRKNTIVFDSDLPVEIIKEKPFLTKTKLKYNRKKQLIEEEFIGDVSTGDSKSIYRYNEKGFISNEEIFLYSGTHVDTLIINYEYIYDKQGNWIVRTELLREMVWEIKNRVIEYK